MENETNEEINLELLLFEFSNNLIDKERSLENGFKNKLCLFFSENFLFNLNYYKYQCYDSYKEYRKEDCDLLKKNINILLDNFKLISISSSDAVLESEMKKLLDKVNDDYINNFEVLIVLMDLLNIEPINVSDYIGMKKVIDNFEETKNKIVGTLEGFDFNSISYIINKNGSKYFYFFQKELNILFIFDFDNQRYNEYVKLILKKENYLESTNDIEIYEFSKFGKHLIYLKVNVAKLLNKQDFDLFYLFNCISFDDDKDKKTPDANVLKRICNNMIERLKKMFQ